MVATRTSPYDYIQPAARRYRTPWTSLNARSRGGLPAGKLVVLTGMPGAGKTGVAVQLARHLAIGGARVTVLATDEGADALAVRLGQLAGAERAALEKRDARALDLAMLYTPATLSLLADVSIERATVDVDVLIVDSIQTARSEATTTRGKRAQVEAVVRALLGAKGRGVLVIATSEMGRQEYRNLAKDPSLASAKGSGDIEYQADMVLALVTRDGGRTVNVTIPKSRIGDDKTGWTWTRDPARASFVEHQPTSPTPAHTTTWRDDARLTLWTLAITGAVLGAAALGK